MSERIVRAANGYWPIGNGLCRGIALCRFQKRDPGGTDPYVRYLLNLLFSFLVLVFSFFTAGASAQAAGVNYVYDSLGRLIAVYDLSGNAAVYQYDAVGNLLSITNYPSTPITGIGLSSGSGQAGSTITIYGTDFCSTPTVTFNGVSATVDSSNSDQIVVTVPSNVTTGQVVVTCGSNQITIGTFTVASAAPSISGFTPSVGAAGTAVTINGSNFQSVAANDSVRVGITPTTANSATTNRIGITVPTEASTGHISVTTSTGQSTSTGYFFVPPAPATPSTLVTGQITIGGSSVNVTTSTATPYALLAFDGTAGQQISLNVTADSISGAIFYIIPPGGTVSSAIGAGQLGTSGGIVADVILPTTGTYSVFVDPLNNATGSVTLQLFSTGDVPINGLTIGGPPVSVGPNLPGQDFIGTFTGTGGQQISLNVTADSIPSAIVYIIPPGGTVNSNGTVTNPTASGQFGTSGGIISDVTLPTTGTYSVYVDPTAYYTGSVTLQLFSTGDVPISGLTIGGPPVSVGPNLPGQDFIGTFTGTGGQQISLNVTADSIPSAIVYIIPPGGTVNSNGTVTNPTASGQFGTSGGIISDVTLPTTGTYSVYVDPTAYYTGSVTLQLFSTGDVPISGLTIGGPPVSVGPNLPGQDFIGTFTGTGGQQISLNVTADSIPSAIVYIIPPGGTVNSNGTVTNPTASGQFGTSGGIISDVTLPTTGTYSVYVDPTAYYTGSVTLQLFSTGDVPISGLTIGGPPVSVGPNLPGQDFIGTFTGTGGQQISLNVTADSIPSAIVYIIPPGGTVNSNGTVTNPTASGQFGTSGGIISDVTLPTTGTYSVYVDPTAYYTGSVTLQLFSTGDVPISGLTIGGPPVSVGPNLPGQDFIGTFTGTGGQQISLNVTADSIPSAIVYIIPPGGTVNSNGTVTNPTASGQFGTSGGIISDVTLPTTGTYSVYVDPTAYYTGSVTLQLFSTGDVPISGLTIGGPPVSVGPNLPGQDFIGTFTGTGGQQISLNVTADSIPSAIVYIIPPGGTVNSNGTVTNPTASGQFGTSGGIISDVTLPTTGTYSVYVDPTAYYTGSVTLQLFSTGDVPISGLTIGGPPVSVGPNLPGQDFIGTFTGTGGQQISLNVTADSIPSAIVYIIPPGGTVNSNGTVTNPTASGQFGTSGGIISHVTLPTTGTYSVYVDPTAYYTGSVTLTLTSP